MSPLVEQGHGGAFRAAVRAEWTKFRTVRGWIITILVAAALPTGFALLNMANARAASPR